MTEAGIRAEVGSGPEDAVRALERLADRLRVVGPRLAGREGEDARATLRQIRAGLQRLADAAADAAGEPRRVVPELAGHALADQALVLGHDALGLDDHRIGSEPSTSVVRIIADVYGLI